VLSGLHSALPTADNRHMALRFLLDAELHVRLSLSPDSPFLSGSTNANPSPRTIAKITLMRILNPAWHPILDECERQMASWTDVSQDSPTFLQ